MVALSFSRQFFLKRNVSMAITVSQRHVCLLFTLPDKLLVSETFR
ncbi:unknown protein [Cronobacter turicensis z3032]|uniref:Uncharacterized protein n=1 Tax=Cronobacter turicensis (strain DSM 18703 / CCUG 55852 / LMG 23827 / z3032) TaxID=693216 RepID=C9Y3G5_CROTZ|nr:unknown protein [Cronobacter turicensis z3032]